MTLRTRLLGMANRVRAIPGRLDLRQYTVTMVVDDWTTANVGQVGTEASRTCTLLTTGDGVTNPRVQEVSSKDIIASGGLLSAQDLKVGPFTPCFDDGGISDDAINPDYGANGREVTFIVAGPGMGPTGRVFERVNDDTVPNFSHMLYLHAKGRAA